MVRSDSAGGARRATIRDVARRAEVSLKTVSRVINHEAAVLQGTRARVMQAIADLDYAPDPAARNLRSATSFTIGLVYDNPNAYYVIGLQQGVLEACREAGFGLQIHPCDAAAPELARTLIESAQRSRLAGLVLAPPMSEDPALVAALEDKGIQLVRIVAGRQPSPAGSPCVFVDDRTAACEITEHLVRLGHQRIGFLGGDPRHRSSLERHAGYVDALSLYGMAVEEALVLRGEYTFDAGFRGARQLLALRDRPTAIFGANDEIAAGALAAAASAGFSVPHELSIAGFEDSPFSSRAWPALTTARQATGDIARQAAHLLIAGLRREPGETCAAGPRSHGFTPGLVVRGSTAPVRWNREQGLQ